MRVKNHGVYPHKMGVWTIVTHVSTCQAYQYYLETLERINMRLPSKEKLRTEATNEIKFDDNFINNGFRILSCGKTVLALHKHDFKYSLICAEPKAFYKAWREHYPGKPSNIAPY